MYETLSELLTEELKTGPRTLDQLVIKFKNERRNVISTNLGTLRRKNIVIKIGDHYELHPSYRRQNGI